MVTEKRGLSPIVPYCPLLSPIVHLLSSLIVAIIAEHTDKVYSLLSSAFKRRVA